MSAPTSLSGGPRGSMLDLLNGFVQELRNAGLPVSLTENLDAMEAVQHIPIEDREAFKYALGATLIKTNSHWRAFDSLGVVYSSRRGPEYKLADGEETVFDFFADTPGRGLAAADLEPDFTPITVHFPSADQVFNVGLGSAAVPGVLKGLLHFKQHTYYLNSQIYVQVR